MDILEEQTENVPDYENWYLLMDPIVQEMMELETQEDLEN